MRRLLLVASLIAGPSFGCSRDVDSVEVARVLVEDAAALVWAAERAGCFDGAPSEVTGGVGSSGSAVARAEGCAVELETDFDPCGPVQRAMGGTVVVSGTRRTLGTVTGDAVRAVVPDGPDATSYAIEAKLEGFVGERRGEPVAVMNVSGRLAIEARVRHAAGWAGGCAAPTPHVALDAVGLDVRASIVDGATESAGHLTGTLSGARGKVGVQENRVAGTIAVDGSAETIDAPLRVDYNAAAFLESFACSDEVARPVSFTCGPPSPAAATRLVAGSAEAMAVVARLAKSAPCGFDAVAPIVQADEPGRSRSTKQIVDCRIDLGEGVEVGVACEGEPTIASGGLRVSGTMTSQGHIAAGGAEVVPSTDDALTFDFTEVVFEGFAVSRGEARTILDGTATGSVQPRLARSKASGLCTVLTPMTRVEHALEDTLVLVDGPDIHATGTIERAFTGATLGPWTPDPNTIEGQVTVAGETHEVLAPIESAFDAEGFEQGWRCGDASTAQPHVCDVATAMAEDIGRGGSALLATVGRLIEADVQCGFSTPSVVANVQVTGAVGSPSGQGVFTISACTLELSQPTVVATDCFGNETWVQGRVSVSGTKTVDGWITGDASEPVLPASRDGVRYDLVLDADGLTVRADAGALEGQQIELVRGTASGIFAPRVAIDEDVGACTILTPEVRVSDLDIAATVRTTREGRTLEANVDSAAIHATAGRFGPDDENRTFGSVTVDGQVVAFEAPLDLGYDARRFVAGFSCREGMYIPFDDRDCDMRQVLAEVGARLLVQTIGTVTEIANGDDFDCAFGGDDVYDEPSNVQGALGQPGFLEWQIAGCRLRYGDGTLREYDRDCRDHAKMIQGAAVVDGRREIHGIRDEIDVTFGSDVQYVHPTTPNATTVEYTAVRFTEFSTYQLAPGTTDPEHRIWIHSGALAGTVEPMTGPDDGSDDYFDRGDYDIPTPIARITGLAASAIDATILYEGKRFRVTIDGSAVDAFSGSWEGAPGETNRLAGNVTIDGRTIELSTEDLDPDFDQAQLDASYVCTERLLETLPPE